MNLNIVRIEKDTTFPMPSVPNAGDAGIDLIATSGGILNPGDNYLVGCGFAIEIPAGYVGMVCPRSGLSAKYHIAVGNAPGIIDSSYRGEVKIILEHRGHRSTNAFQWRRGDRLAQLVIVPFVAVASLTEVSELSSSERGADGFGSTGMATVASSVNIVSVTHDLEADVEELLVEAAAAKTRGKKSSK